MYRVLLFISFLAYCFSAPIIDSGLKKTVSNDDNDDGDVIDIPGGGYSFFKQQKVDVQGGVSSMIDMPAEDLAAYMHGSSLKGESNGKQKTPSISNPTFDNSFGQQQSISQSDSPWQNLLLPTVQNKKPSLSQNDFSQLPSTSRNKYNNQKGNFNSRKPTSSFNTFGNLQQQDSRTIGSLQGLSQRNINLPQSEQLRSRQQNPFGSGSLVQQTFPSNSFLQSNQQKYQPSISDALFMSSQRFKPLK